MSEQDLPSLPSTQSEPLTDAGPNCARATGSLSDFQVCELLIAQCLTAEQRQVIDGYPVWELDPPQRENYECAADYVSALSDYTSRVLSENDGNQP